MRRLVIGCVMIAALFAAPRADASPILTLLPSTGTAGADPGQTAGWGYEVTNDDPGYWLVLTGLTVTTPFAYGTVNDLIFDYPILAPQTSVTQNWLQGSAGLLEFTWDLTAPAGFVNTGVFTIAAELWDADPFLGGQFVESIPDFTLAY